MNYKKNNAVKFYFEENTKYKVKYPEKIVFSDIDGKGIVTDNNFFVHYLDGNNSRYYNVINYYKYDLLL